ncbi:sorbin and SH3 domain-containing protein 1 isoform X10 [Danaus plexippus]|uniref:sorbin and SH3 domain-containing protein 1 isoform X10 n=1 Tax=Danaus plexippus TaxID=13037 RepID=UPI002AB1D2C4|nr:sorbin and SH3 domain-containing protein 1 isoform X10 [Danaus plexippus]
MSTREVELTGGAPWGFRMHGGVDQNQPLRISRVNPGRKASLSGIREGDVISSINGKTTKDMSNSDAHAMLRFSGPVLRLGLNEDRDTSPRRRSIPKATELKRPSQLIDGAEKATPHPPVYATIKQPNSPNKLPAKSPSNKSVQLVKSFEDTQNFHPTNPFYSTLPNTKLQITNGKSNSLQRSVNRTNYDDLKMSSFFKKNDPGAGSPNAGYQTSETSPRRFSFDKFSYDVKDSNNEDQIKKNPFNNGTNDFNPTDKLDGSPDGASMIYSKSDSNFRRNEFTEYTERKSVTEEMISETEEIKTIKKITLNGSSESDKPNGVHKLDSDRNNKERIVPMTLYDEGIKVNENRRNVGENTSREEYKEGDTKSTPVPAQSPSHITTQKNQPIWRPGVTVSEEPPASAGPPPPPPPPVWSPSSTPQASRKFKPVHFEQTPPERRKFSSSDHNGCNSGSESEGRLRTSLSAPAAGLNSLGSNNRLPRAQNPTVTLLQKAREGQLQRNIPQESDPRLPRDRPSPPRGDPVHALRKEYASESEADRSDHERGGQKMADGKKIDGIGPITKDGMPVALRSEVKDPSRWYKKMYDTIHKNKYDEDYVTIRYKNNRGETLQRPSSNRSQYAYFDPRSGYLSEPEGGRPTTDTRRRTASVQDDRNEITPHKYSTLASSRVRQEVYKNQPGRIEDYVPGKSSVIDTEAKQWWDEVMDIFDGWLDENSPLPPYSTLLARAIQKSQNESNTPAQPQPSPKDKKDLTSAILSKSNMARALKESGYESDSTIVFRRQAAPLSPSERRAAYRDLQAGGEPPRGGFRSPAPNRQEGDTAPEPPRRASQSCSDSESPNRRYIESDVNIHYRCPVRHDPLPLVPERELARQQADHMKRLYREQRRNKYLQENSIHPLDIEAFDASIKELQDMQNRRHQDNFMPSQKTIVPLNRYDEAERIVAKALYTFNGQTSRELSFRKGDIINVRRQIDSNWYEGEVHGKVGLFPYNYVELMKGDGVQTLKKTAIVEGRAKAKFDFTAQTNLELPLKKGEVVVLTRRIDHNWWEGRTGNKTGIFPDSYVTILQEPSQSRQEPEKPVGTPAAHGLMNGDRPTSHRYTPQHNSPALSNAPPATAPLPSQGYIRKSSSTRSADLNNTEPLYVDTNAEAVPYRAMYKYRPQNPDELELLEGETVYVLEKCDDGWYVGSSQRTGRFGTFPGNYVERI